MASNFKVVKKSRLKAAFSKDHERPSPVDIHEWVENDLKVLDGELTTLQLVGKYNAAYLKFSN